MLIASTGLGKTIVATHIALKLFREDKIGNVLIIGPKLVKKQWEFEFRVAKVPQCYVGCQALDKEDPNQDWNLEHFLEIEEEINKHWLIIIDESHQFRNCHERQEGFKRRSFQRLVSRIEQSGCKVILLTGSPYSKDIENLNHQLLLLPHTAESLTVLSNQKNKNFIWRADSIKKFIKLDVVSQLTTPYVAKKYGQKSNGDIAIEFGEEKRFIPHVMLYRFNFLLFMESEISHVFQTGCFDAKGCSIIKNEAEVSWTSSPHALRECLQKVLNTPGDLKLSYDVDFEMSQPERYNILKPILDRLHEMRLADDPKLLSLCEALKNIYSNSNKSIIFCERRATVIYLVEALTQLLPSLRVFGTVQQRGNQYEQKKDSEIFQAIKKFAPISNRAEGKYKETYDVFISTDAYGVGINLQDAPVVINYDLAWTAIEPTQRAGRVLRPWREPRTVELYAFVPPLESDALRDLGIAKRYSNLTQRHSHSQEILELPVLSVREKEEVNLLNTTSKVTIQSGELDLDALVDDNISPYYQHASRLYNNRDYARKVRDDVISAKTYPGRTIMIYVLFKHNDEHKWAIYEHNSKTLKKVSRNQLLDWLQCDENTERALVNADAIEDLSHTCLKEWCKQYHFNLEDVVRECAIYLKPAHQPDTLESLARY
jgi:superfamily II DNA or RNA helicase